MKKLIVTFMLAGVSVLLVSAQMTINLQVDQPEALSIHTGNNYTVCAGTKIKIGADVLVVNNVGEVFYSWYPAEKLDDPTSSNPTLIAGNSQNFVLTVTDSRGCLVQGEIKVKARLCDDLVKQSEGSIKVYPNPASDFITVEMPFAEWDQSISLKVVNTLGQDVFSNTSNDGRDGGMLKISVLDFSPGMYFVQLISGNKLFVERIQIR